jgi:hypothetical protein
MRYQKKRVNAAAWLVSTFSCQCTQKRLREKLARRSKRLNRNGLVQMTDAECLLRLLDPRC